MTTHKDYLEHKKNSNQYQAGVSPETALKKRQQEELNSDVDAFLAAGGSIKSLEGFERACEGDKPISEVSTKKKMARERRYAKEQLAKWGIA